MGQVTPGAEGSGSLSRRVGKIERFLAPFSRQRIQAENELGKPYIYPVLAGTGVPGKKADVKLPLTVWRAPAPDGNKVVVIKGRVNDAEVEGADAPDKNPTLHSGSEIHVKATINFDDDTTEAEIVTAAVTPSITATTLTSSLLLAKITYDDDGNAVVEPIHSGGNLGVDCFGAATLWWRR